MATSSNAERKRHYRERLKTGQQPRLRYPSPKDKRSRDRHWTNAVETLINLPCLAGQRPQ